jgi:hypothetical protein
MKPGVYRKDGCKNTRKTQKKIERFFLRLDTRRIKRKIGRRWI